MIKNLVLMFLVFSNTLLLADKYFYIPKITQKAEAQLNYANNMITLLKKQSKIPKKIITNRIVIQLNSLLNVYPMPYFNPLNTITNTKDPKILKNEGIQNLIKVKLNFAYYKKFLITYKLIINRNLQKEVDKFPELFKLAVYKKDVEIFVKFFPVSILSPTTYFNDVKYSLAPIEKIYVEELKKLIPEYKKLKKENKIYNLNKTKLPIYLAKLDIINLFITKNQKNLLSYYIPFVKNLYNYIYINKNIPNKYEKFINSLGNYLMLKYPYYYNKINTKYYYYYYQLENTKLQGN